MLDFAVFPNLRRRLPAAAADIDGGKREWWRSRGRVRDGVFKQARFRREPAGIIGIVSAQFHRAGDCRQPLYFAPTMATDLHETRRVVPERQIQVNDWKMDTSAY